MCLLTSATKVGVSKKFMLWREKTAQLKKAAVTRTTCNNAKSYSTPICDEIVKVKNMGILQHLQVESRNQVDPNGERWSYFNVKSPNFVGTGSLLRITYLISKTSTSPVLFSGVLIGIRRSTGNPTFIIRGIIDDVGVEQVFSIFSPLITKIELLRSPTKKSSSKLYELRETPGKIARFQRIAQEASS